LQRGQAKGIINQVPRASPDVESLSLPPGKNPGPGKCQNRKEIGEVALAMTRRIGLGALANTIHPYPTQAEVLKKLGDAYQKMRLTPRVASWLRWLLSWRRR
jgi:hypothetical protein